MKCPSGDQNPGEKAPDATSFRSEPSGLSVYNCVPSVVTEMRLPSGDHEANHTLNPRVICFLSVPSTRITNRSRCLWGNISPAYDSKSAGGLGCGDGEGWGCACGVAAGAGVCARTPGAMPGT